MARLDATLLSVLNSHLDADVVPHLPAPLRPLGQQANRSRALCALGVSMISGCSLQSAAEDVIDDYADFGIDLIRYDAASKTLFVGQAKYKPNDQFLQEDAQSLCRGLRKLALGDLDDFNANLQNRRAEVETALTECTSIRIVIVYAGPGVTGAATAAIQEFLDDKSHGEVRLHQPYDQVGPDDIVAYLRDRHAPASVDKLIALECWSTLPAPTQAYSGILPLTDLVSLHDHYGRDLYQSNVRMYLGGDTSVNQAIYESLRAEPERFLLLNNGVTGLCISIDPKNSTGGKKQLEIKGLSVINGAQTISTAAKAHADGIDISLAKVGVTLIVEDPNQEIGKSITMARNRQNAVSPWSFASLDDEQERIRRDLAIIGIAYRYHADDQGSTGNPGQITIQEATEALALMLDDPRHVAWVKTGPGRFLDRAQPQYASLFPPGGNVIPIANAVDAVRLIKAEIATLAGASPAERAAYVHGAFAITWLTLRRLEDVPRAVRIDAAKVAAVLPATIQAIAAEVWVEVQRADPGALALFRSQTETVRLLQDVEIKMYGLTGDAALAGIVSTPGDPYPVAIFRYLKHKAPKLAGLV